MCSLLQIHDGDIDGVVASLLNDGAGAAVRDRLHARARCAWYWITTSCAGRVPVPAPRSRRVSGAPVSPPVAAAVAGLRERLASGQRPAGADAPDAKALHQAIYDVADAHGMEARELFAELYRILIDKDRGPRLAEFILTIGVSRIDSLLANVTARDG